MRLGVILELTKLVTSVQNKLLLQWLAAFVFYQAIARASSTDTELRHSAAFDLLFTSHCGRSFDCVFQANYVKHKITK